MCCVSHCMCCIPIRGLSGPSLTEAVAVDPTRRCGWHCRRSSGPSSSRSCRLRPPSSRSPSQRTAALPVATPSRAALSVARAAPEYPIAIPICAPPTHAVAMAALPTAHLSMLLHRTHVLGRMSQRARVCRYRHRREHPEAPSAVQCASCDFLYACFPTTSAVSRSDGSSFR